MQDKSLMYNLQKNHAHTAATEVNGRQNINAV